MKELLPDPQGPLRKTVPSASIEEVNEEVKAELKEKYGKACAPYMVVTPKQKAKKGKYIEEKHSARVEEGLFM